MIIKILSTQILILDAHPKYRRLVSDLMSKTPISILLIATVLSLGCIIVPSVHAQAGPVVRTNTDVPVDEQFFIPCANNNQGDTIQISGTAHEVFDVTVDNNGGFHLHENSNGQDL